MIFMFVAVNCKPVTALAPISKRNVKGGAATSCRVDASWTVIRWSQKDAFRVEQHPCRNEKSCISKIILFFLKKNSIALTCMGQVQMWALWFLRLNTSELPLGHSSWTCNVNWSMFGISVNVGPCLTVHAATLRAMPDGIPTFFLFCAKWLQIIKATGHAQLNTTVTKSTIWGFNSGYYYDIRPALLV